jgi:hypothetical protein
MFDTLFHALKSEICLSHLEEISCCIRHMLDLIDEGYLNDPKLRNECIEAIKLILDEHKDFE